MKSELFWTALAVLIYSAGCTGYSITGGPGQAAPPSLQSSAADYKDLASLNVILLSPIVFEKQAISSTTAKNEMFNKQLLEAISSGTDLEVVPPARGSDADRGIQSGSPDIAAWLAAANRLGADGVLITRLRTYQDRQGSAAAAEQGARVAFTMTIYQSGDGRPIWQASYHFEDTALSDNLFKLRNRLEGGTGWLSADRVLRSGFDAAARDLSRTREAAFAGKRLQ